MPYIVQVPCPWEVFFKLMERASHHPICQVERLLHPVTMMDVDVNVEYTLERLQQFKNRKHTIVNVAESASLALFGMVQPATPVDSNVVLFLR
jgi:hypothetical protein